MDKFTVLRLALQHIKSLLGSARPAAGAASLYKPSFVSDEEIKQLMKYSNDGFILVADCDRARILFTSQSTEQAVKRESKVCHHSCNGSSSINTDNTDALFTLSLRILKLNSECIEGASDVNVH